LLINCQFSTVTPGKAGPPKWNFWELLEQAFTGWMRYMSPDQLHQSTNYTLMTVFH